MQLLQYAFWALYTSIKTKQITHIYKRDAKEEMETVATLHKNRWIKKLILHEWQNIKLTKSCKSKTSFAMRRERKRETERERHTHTHRELHYFPPHILHSIPWMENLQTDIQTQYQHALHLLLILWIGQDPHHFPLMWYQSYSPFPWLSICD